MSSDHSLIQRNSVAPRPSIPSCGARGRGRWPRAELLPRLGLRSAHDSFRRDGWRFVVLDSLDLSVCGVSETSAAHARAEAWLASHPLAEYPNAYRWNGGLGRGMARLPSTESMRAVSSPET